LDDSQFCIQLPWNPPTPVEALFKNQLKEDVTFLATGGKALSNTQSVTIGGKNQLPSKPWQRFKTISVALTSVDNPQPPLDSLDTMAPTTPTVPTYTRQLTTPLCLQPPTNDQIIADTVHTQVALALATMNLNGSNNNHNGNRNDTNTGLNHRKSYCCLDSRHNNEPSP
jgi:hypothetical protein